MSPSRRDFLKASLGASTLVALSPTAPAFLGRTAEAFVPSRKDRDTVLVVVQLAGGNDGLNTVVPYEDDDYGRARPTLRLPTAQLHKIDEHLGLHPKLRAFSRLLKEGHLAIVQGVGYPNPQQGHTEAMHIWQTARVDARDSQTGWIGRTVDSIESRGAENVPAAFIGGIRRPFSLNGQRALIPTLHTLDDWKLRTMPGAPGVSVLRQKIAEVAKAPRGEPANLLAEFVQRSTLSACARCERIEAAVRDKPGDYPPFHFAGQLRTISQLIRADLGIRIYYTELGGEEPGGFDTHAGQALNHGALLEQLSESVAAFVDDLNRDKLLDRVLLLTFSEFGRTVKENGRRGTDHGSAGPMFLFGGRLKGGLVGRHPNLTDLENGGQRFHTDFRRVYATALGAWLGFDNKAILGEEFSPLELLRDG